MRVQAQVEVLPVGSGKGTVDGQSMSTDAAVAYGISAGFDYAVTPYLSIGVAPRFLLNVKPDDSMASDSSDKELDLRARVLAHYPVRPGLDVYASLMPGYTIVLSSEDGVKNPTGFALGGAVGVTYDVAPKMFVGAEVGYQRAFTSTELTVLDQKINADLDLSYMHIGIGAGTRF
jgi:opacity protein-like surface antigen